MRWGKGESLPMQVKILSLKEKLSNGVSPAMATPLESGSYRVNTAVIPQLIDFLLGKGVKGFFVGGTTGEGIMLDPGERKKLHEATLATVNGRVPVLLHIGSQRGDTAVELARHAAGINADAVAAVTPYFYGMHDDALAAYSNFGVNSEAPITSISSAGCRNFVTLNCGRILVKQVQLPLCWSHLRSARPAFCSPSMILWTRSSTNRGKKGRPN